jgi:hypothetical protein
LDDQKSFASDETIRSVKDSLPVRAASNPRKTLMGPGTIQPKKEADVKGVLIVAVVCLAIGLFIIFYFCNGGIGLSLAYPMSAASIHIDVTTTGFGVPIAVGLVAIGAFLLIVATIIALVGMFRRNGEYAPSRRRESAFEE